MYIYIYIDMYTHMQSTGGMRGLDRDHRGIAQYKGHVGIVEGIGKVFARRWRNGFRL